MTGFLHVVAWIVVVTVLGSLSTKHSADFVFLSKSKLGGWESDFVSFNLGIILITWAFVGFDASAHVAEDTIHARHVVPRSMFWSICVNA